MTRRDIANEVAAALVDAATLLRADCECPAIARIVELAWKSVVALGATGHRAGKGVPSCSACAAFAAIDMPAALGGNVAGSRE